MRAQSHLPGAKSSWIRVSCPLCNGIVAAPEGDSAVQALVRHLEWDHWYPTQLAQQAAREAFDKKIQ
jgi:hypothetical protein